VVLARQPDRRAVPRLIAGIRRELLAHCPAPLFTPEPRNPGTRELGNSGRTAMTTELTFDTRTGPVEALADVPTGRPRAAVVVCHSMPERGGSMREPVVQALAEHLAGADCAVVRVDMRRPMKAPGAKRPTKRKVLNMAAIRGAIDYFGEEQKKWGREVPLVGVGYSFGAQALCSASRKTGGFRALALVGPPIHGKGAHLPMAENLPSLIVAGQADEYCRPEKMRNLAALEAANITVLVLEGTDHYLKGRESDVAKAVVYFVLGQVDQHM